MVKTNSTGTEHDRMVPTIIIPLPDHDFDPTECAIPWKVLTSRGYKVKFSTEQGNVAQADRNLLKGPILGPLGASAKARAAYQQMTQESVYQHPIPYAEMDPNQYQAILLPGGHAPGMRQYVESRVLRDKVLQFWQQNKLIATICHGMLILARTIDPQTGRSILYSRKVTALPQSVDRSGYLLNARLLKRGYLMDACTVEEEVRACLEHPEDLSMDSLLVPHVVCDGNLITARYPVDVQLFSERIVEALEQRIHAG
jgi:putative intracellular protease/amidase